MISGCRSLSGRRTQLSSLGRRRFLRIKSFSIGVRMNDLRYFVLIILYINKIYTSPYQNCPRSKQMKTGGEIIVGHLQAFCSWIMMMIMTVYIQYIYIYIYLFIYTYFTLMPVLSQFRQDLAPPPAAPCASVQSCRRTATGLDNKSPGVIYI